MPTCRQCDGSGYVCAGCGEALTTEEFIRNDCCEECAPFTAKRAVGKMGLSGNTYVDNRKKAANG